MNTVLSSIPRLGRETKKDTAAEKRAKKETGEAQETRKLGCGDGWPGMQVKSKEGEAEGGGLVESGNQVEQ